MNLNNLDPGITVSYTDPEQQLLDETRQKLGMERETGPDDPEQAFKDFFARQHSRY